ncbi:MAG: universal stress protein [Deltaproteobacteria bacterium]|nr:universal stress protein [Deltaproteobacteria bacterium]
MSGLPERGDVIDGFRIEERIHAGGMGVIYRVSGPETGFPMIMKIPRLGPGEPGEAVVTFEVERMVLGALTGPHVPRFVAAGDLARIPYLVMERVEGRPLADWVGKGPVPPAEVARLGLAVANALHSLHLQNVVHLDVKPSNVILRESGEAVLIDFGIAHHGHFPDLLAEEFRRPMGSAPYLSPEQVLGARDDARSDLFALGAVLYELCTGRMPFGSPTSPAGLRVRLHRDPVPPRALVPGLPEWLQEVILRCLEPDAADRYATAAQVAFDLGHPDQVTVTSQGRRTRRLGVGKRMVRWLRAIGYGPDSVSSTSLQLAAAPIVLVAVATAHTNEARNEALRATVRRLVIAGEPTRLACITVIRPAPELVGADRHEAATSQRIKQLVQLRHWAEPLKLPPQQISYHVMESGDPAGALLEYARANHVDHVVIGSPPRDVTLGGLLGTVSTKVSAEAPCTVTVVRVRG